MAEQQIRFDDGAAYEQMMGIWSRSAGEIFLDWLTPPLGMRWAVPIASVTATQLGEHLGLTRQRIGSAADIEHVIERLPNGRFNQDQSRLKYLAHLRLPERRSAGSEAAAKHTEAKTALLQVRIMEKQRTLVPHDVYDAMIDQMAGLVLTHLSGMAARCSRDLTVRRNIDAVVDQIRREIAVACVKAADERNEPPLNEQD